MEWVPKRHGTAAAVVRYVADRDYCDLATRAWEAAVEEEAVSPLPDDSRSNTNDCRILLLLLLPWAVAVWTQSWYCHWSEPLYVLREGMWQYRDRARSNRRIPPLPNSIWAAAAAYFETAVAVVAAVAVDARNRKDSYSATSYSNGHWYTRRNPAGIVCTFEYYWPLANYYYDRRRCLLP